MGTISKYLCKEFIKLLIICQTAFVSLYLVIDFTQKIGSFMEADASNRVMIMFFIYKLPLVLVQMAPATCLISVVVLFSLMKKNNEITALKACGVSVIKLSLPVLAASICLTVAVFLFSELVVPYASKKSTDIWYSDVKKRSQARYYDHVFMWYRSHRAIYWIRFFNIKSMEMVAPTFYFFDDEFHVTERIDAKRAAWVKDSWKVQEGTIMKLRDDGSYGFERFNEMDLMLPETPEAFVKIDKLPEEMSYWELRRYAEKTAHKGYDDTRFIVDQHLKLAFPLLSFIMALMGIPVALILKKGGTPLAVCLGITACFLYIVIFGFTRSLGYAGVLPPMLSAWLANFAFLLLGAYMLMRVET
jgi:lipopolysaccharide export system permease protein